MKAFFNFAVEIVELGFNPKGFTVTDTQAQKFTVSERN